MAASTSIRVTEAAIGAAPPAGSGSPGSGPADSRLADSRPAELGARRRMDRMYRHQRHIYDLTRKFYLIGRDAMLDGLPASPGARICEFGCGTGRNLVRLARRRPEASLYGFDVSSEMLTTARAALRRAGLEARVRLAEAPAGEFDPQRLFGLERFDTVYFSYVLSMVPDWRSAVDRALSLLRPGGTLAVVDFADQREASPLRRRALLAWLALFDVHPRPEIETELLALARSHDAAPRHVSVGRGYAYRLMFQTPG
jgi:S-adenosylmethionine-diacylgycerolhomoserine-N-methlytransferase